MPGRRPSLIALRATAVALTIAMSGPVVAAAIPAPVEKHRCSCRHHGDERDCRCGTCRRQALEARASDDAAPPCHREAAKKALRAAEKREESSAPCIEGSCGSFPEAAAAVARGEPVLMRPPPAIAAAAGGVEAVEERRSAARDRAVPPLTPPPRA